MEWPNFNYKEEVYDLSHLHPFQWSFTEPMVEGNRPERTYKFHVYFSDHCFTRDPLPGEVVEERRLYHHAPKGPRIFCFKRHQYSLKLRETVASLNDRPCWKTGKGNFFTAEFMEESGEKVEYEVYFNVTKSNRKGWLNMNIQSAFVRTEEYESTQPLKRKIRLHVIAYNKQRGKVIR